MVGLLDIAPITEAVSVRGQQIEVRGISAKGVAVILSRFPVIRQLMAGVRKDEITADDLIALAPDAIASIIAAGCGHPGDEKAEKIAADLAAEEQADLVVAILRLTMPGGVRPFVEKLMQLESVISPRPAVAGGKAPATKSQKQ